MASWERFNLASNHTCERLPTRKVSARRCWVEPRKLAKLSTPPRLLNIAFQLCHCETYDSELATLLDCVMRWGNKVGGVNHCSLHCRLAKFRGLMYRVKYGAVIGLIKPIAWKLLLGTYKKTRFPTNHSAVFDPVHQTTEFRQTTV